MVERCNSEISKIILGQTGTTDEKSYSGSANVHESVAAMIAKQDTLKMQFIIEDQLVPMMIRNGFDLTGCTFKYDDSENLPLMEQAKIDASFMPYVKFEHEYLEHKYGIELQDEMGVEEEEEEKPIETENEEELTNIAKRLRNIYS